MRFLVKVPSCVIRLINYKPIFIDTFIGYVKFLFEIGKWDGVSHILWGVQYSSKSLEVSYYVDGCYSIITLDFHIVVSAEVDGKYVGIT